MPSDDRFAREVADRQRAMFIMFVGQGRFTTRAALAAASRIPESTLKSWANGAAMPLHDVLALRPYLPREAINMLTEPAGVRLVDIVSAQTNWDAAAADAAGLVSEVCEARRDGKIDHAEDARLRQRSKHLIAALSEIAEEG